MSTDPVEILARILGESMVAPSRRLLTPSGARVRGLFPSSRFSRRMPWESPLERQLIYRLEASWRVKDAVTQPARLQLTSPEGETFSYTPDAVALNTEGRLTIVECKPREELEQPSTAERLSWVRLALGAAGLRFVVLTEAELSDEVINDNVWKLIDGLRARPSREAVLRGDELLRSGGDITFADLVATCDLLAALRLLAGGRAFFDIRRPLIDSTPLTQILEETHDAALFLCA